MLSPIVIFQENETTLAGRSKSDAREIQNFYQHYYKKYIQALQNAADKADRLVIWKHGCTSPNPPLSIWKLGITLLYSIDKLMFLVQCPTYESISNCGSPIWSFEGCQSNRSCGSSWWGENESFCSSFSYDIWSNCNPSIGLEWARVVVLLFLKVSCLSSIFLRFWKLTLR